MVFELDEGESCRRVQKEEPSFFSRPAVAISQQSMLRIGFTEEGVEWETPVVVSLGGQAFFSDSPTNRTIAFDGDKFKI